ncbi:type IX secretion system outer membrane channel protein PorV [Dyadobacter psychrotolerans]|uniref:Type IX secretion system outer membrane channel protein PorV n=1 Tax=Dyadobacter psychrotolerans TaxID=2541721 RepID=A0A4R5DX54_9BACT|nr:type IX secretion system outer membrane channel protein PorV [Dyadobacter psychrotolerans]TDE17224.1 type IX secretion system outer membrane channel protein PorV [Dyadobacter psychrotolerans]
MKTTFINACLLALVSGSCAQAQTVPTIRIPQSSVPFLTYVPDARSAGMGATGVASTPDANASYWNVSKLAFIEQDFGASVSYVPWLSNLVDDMWLGYASAYYKLPKGQAITASFGYFNDGDLVMSGSPRSDFSVSAGYARQLGRNFSMGITLKYISSELAGYGYITPGVYKTGKTVAADISAFYKKEVFSETNGRSLGYTVGAVLSNFGDKISYGSAFGDGYLPTTFKLGGGLSFAPNDRNRISFVLDASKLLVPYSPNPVNVNSQPFLTSIYKSFSDAPGGLSEELQEVTISVGAEYLYKSRFALRGGYFGENKNKGDRKFFTAGAGVRFLKHYSADASYDIPLKKDSPFKGTKRITISMDLAKN